VSSDRGRSRQKRQAASHTLARRISRTIGGAYITIAGVTGKKKIVGIAGTTVTLDSAADATVSGAAVASSAASFRATANLDTMRAAAGPPA
jgi:hypothetical protein